MHQPVYDLRRVSRAFGRGDTVVAAVRDVDLEIGRGELLAIVGPSGSGKTTLLQLLGGLDRPSSGEARFEGGDLGAMSDAELTVLRREAFGFVFQQFNLVPTLTAAQNVEAALAPTGMGHEQRRARVAALLQSVGLSHRGHHLPSRLSGGEQQRVAIARPRQRPARAARGRADGEPRLGNRGRDRLAPAVARRRRRPHGRADHARPCRRQPRRTHRADAGRPPPRTGACRRRLSGTNRRGPFTPFRPAPPAPVPPALRRRAWPRRRRRGGAGR